MKNIGKNPYTNGDLVLNEDCADLFFHLMEEYNLMDAWKISLKMHEQIYEGEKNSMEGEKHGSSA